MRYPVVKGKTRIDNYLISFFVGIDPLDNGRASYCVNIHAVLDRRQGKSKSLVMKTIKIKTFNLKSGRNTDHFFILSKGYNAGKPLEQPCPNCFIVTAESEEHKHQLFWICYSLWKSGTFLRLLRGSVIPFLNIREASAEIEKAIQCTNSRKPEFEKNVAELRKLIRTAKLLNAQVKLIDAVISSFAKKLIKN